MISRVQAQRCNLLPNTFDPARPHDPYYDPDYKRRDHDIGKLFREEIESGAPIILDQMIIEEIELQGATEL